jgi:hypothetical protein
MANIVAKRQMLISKGPPDYDSKWRLYIHIPSFTSNDEVSKEVEVSQPAPAPY